MISYLRSLQKIFFLYILFSYNVFLKCIYSVLSRKENTFLVYFHTIFLFNSLVILSSSSILGGVRKCFGNFGEVWNFYLNFFLTFFFSLPFVVYCKLVLEILKIFFSKIYSYPWGGVQKCLPFCDKILSKAP